MSVRKILLTLPSYQSNSDQPYWSDNYIKKVDGGYYYISNDCLYFFDIETENNYVVCSSPDCNHSNEDCSAYLGIYGDENQFGFLTTGLEVYDSYIYVVGYEKSTVTDFYLYRLKKDGTAKEKLFYLYSTDQDNYFYTYTMHNGYLYNFINDGNTSGLERIDLNNEKETIFDLSNYYDSLIDTIVGYGDYIYFDALWYEDEEKNNLVSRLYRYHTSSGETEIVLEHFICNEFLMLDAKTILYMDLSYNICTLDLSTSTNEVKTIYPSSGNFATYSYDGNYLYVQDISGTNIDVYDLTGSHIDTIEVPIGNCLFGDSEYLFIADVIESSTTTDSSNVYWYVLPKKQIGQEHKEFIKLKNKN